MKRTPTRPALHVSILQLLAFYWLGLAGLFSVPLAAADEVPRQLLRGATATNESVVFACAGQLWRVPLDASAGVTALPLTDGRTGEDRYPLASPDGRWIAFSRTAGGNEDVWLLPTVEGSQARRLTFNPKSDRPRGWTPDGERILFASGRDGDGTTRLYTVGRADAFPEPLPLPQGVFGALSPDGSRLAYAPVDWGTEEREYRFYRGGQTSPLWIATLEDSEVEVLAEATSNHRYPMWLGDTLYYLNDASGTFNLYSHSLTAGTTRPLTDYHGHGIRSASLASGGERIVFVRAGRLFVRELASGETRQLDVRVQPDASEGAAKEVPLADWIESVQQLPGSDELIVAARGDLVRFRPASGEAVNLTTSSDAADRDPVVSPDGRWLAYFSDRSGEYQLHLRRLDRDSAAVERVLPIEKQPSFYRQPVFSSDGRYLAFSGKRLGLWLADVEAGTVARIDRSEALEQELWHPSFSPDGRYLAYAKAFASHQRAVFLYDTESGSIHPVTPSTLHAERPVFDKNGKYLYFLSSHNAPVAVGTEIWGQLSAELMAPDVVYRVEAVVLRAGDPPPMLAALGEPHPQAKSNEVRAQPHIDFDGISERIVLLPLRPRVYQELVAGAPGVLLLRTSVWPEAPGAGRPSRTPLYRYDLSSHDFDELVEDVDAFSVAADGSRLLYLADDAWHLWSLPAGGQADGQSDVQSGDTEGSGAAPSVIEWADARLQVDPAAEWRQIYREAWRLMRDYFYDPGHHGRDLGALAEHFADYLPAVTRRADLDFLLAEMLGQVSISHMGIRGGDRPRPAGSPERIGLLGARFEVDPDVGRYRIAEVYRPGQTALTSGLARAAPLAQPGVDAREGEYLLAIDGESLDASVNLYAALRGTAFRPVTLRLGPAAASTKPASPMPDVEGAREVTVVPISGENGLLRASWYEGNRRRVEALSEGRLGYVAVPNYGSGAIQEFLGQLAAQADKQGMIIDQRFNPGGITSDTLIQMLTAIPLHRYAFPYGGDLTVPTTLVSGPKVVLINEHNASAGETFPLMFQIAQAGTLVGKRTSGAGTGGALYYPRLIDGGRITIPNRASYNPRTGSWAENDGVHPDVEVENWPAAWRRGHDAQLETAVEIALQQLGSALPSQSAPSFESGPSSQAGRPAYPVQPQ